MIGDPNASRLGFSLIEVIAAVVLVTILTGGAAGYYAQTMRETRISIVEHDLKLLRRQVRLQRLRSPYAPLRSIEDLEEVQADSRIDPWGEPYVFQLDLMGIPRFVMSSGPDRVIDPPGRAGPDDLVEPLDPPPPKIHKVYTDEPPVDPLQNPRCLPDGSMAPSPRTESTT